MAKKKTMDSIRFKLPKSLKAEFQKYCIDRDTDMSKRLVMFVENYRAISVFLQSLQTGQENQ